ncbi:hypothetical protein HIM_01760 [Hirsutella minnesotensis 3608]|nr:hypothetical protein HIM_01760 [Hirsutella minnesotensis 3608]
MENDPLQELANPAQTLKWLEAQPVNLQEDHAKALFEQLLKAAAQPKSVSGQACVRLCGLVEQLSNADSESLRKWAVSQDVTLRLFNFYVDWNESDHHRSMKLVLDLIAQSIKKNPDKTQASAVKSRLLDALLSIITGRSTKPVAKSAIKTLDHFLTKGVIALSDVHASYLDHRRELAQQDSTQVWKMFSFEIFRWMRLHFVCPTAGRFIVCVYRLLGREDEGQFPGPTIDEWYQWLLDFASQEPALLESIKNYIFLPLFKADRAEGLRFLDKMNQEQPAQPASKLDLDTPALLRLAALETGKKIGLVEEPRIGGNGVQDGEASTITIQEQMLDNVLAHPAHEVRSLAVSLLVASPSTTRPYSSTALDLLRKHLSSFFADSDAKFRVEVSGKVRDMFKRMRGAIHVLKRSIPRARANAQKAKRAEGEGKVNGNSNAGCQVIQYRSNLILLPETQLQDCLRYHEAFLRWYIGFLCSELVPTASYQRHIASLKALGFILRMEGESSKTWQTEDDQQLFFDLFDDKWARALFDLLMDPFEDVRDGAANILKRLYADSRYRRFSLDNVGDERRILDTVSEVARRAEQLARRTSRADHSDGASRATQLLYGLLGSEDKQIAFLSRLIGELERKTLTAENDLGRAVLDSPLHGDFASMSHVLQVTFTLKLAESSLGAVHSLLARLISCCERVWEAVKDVLCDDSPEGHLPQELEEVEGLDTKGLLSFSFRAVHESSNLLRTVVLTARNRSRSGTISPTSDLFERIGNLTFNQLSNLRHRGAFTTVASTFATCCQQTKHFDQDRSLLNIWYQGTIDAIFSQASTTRRSAGIPSMMTGVLSANASDPSFEHVMEELMAIASKEARVTETDGSNLSQVHAYNCLKDIFKNSMLTSMGNKAEKYLPQCLELAASGLRSEVWAIRNCGLLLLRSLIDSLFGSQESKSMIEAGWDGKANRIAYHRYPNLPTVLRNLLMSGHQMLAQATTASTAAESVFPALDIVRRAGPPELLRDEIQGHVAVYLSSPVWHVRELAARTLCSCLLHEGWFGVMRQLIKAALDDTGRNALNHIHGVLLALKFLTERLGEVAVDYLKVKLAPLTEFLTQCSISSRFSCCPNITAAYLDVANTIWAFESRSSLPLSDLQESGSLTSGAVLLRNQSVILRVYRATADNRPAESLRTLFMKSEVDAEGLVTGLETLPVAFPAASLSNQILLELASLLVDFCTASACSDAQSVAVDDLAGLLDEILKREIWSRPEPCAANLQSWGRMMGDAGLDDKTFDTRFAAAESLLSFFSVAGPRSATDEHLAALLALYDSLNRLVGHCGVRARDSRAWASAADQLAEALTVDDSLFVVEEQNLFVDEVRETELWAGAFCGLQWSAGDDTLVRLDAWVRGGVARLGQLAEREDGPLGWTSDPRVFAICTRLVRVSDAMMKHHGSPALVHEVQRTKEMFAARDTHISRLLTDTWTWD